MKFSFNKPKSQTIEKLWTPLFVFMMFITILIGIATNMNIPILPMYAVNMGVGLGIAGTLSGLFAIAALVFRPIAGITADRFNKKILLVIFTIISGIIFLGYAISGNIYTLFAFRLVHGICFSFSSTIMLVLSTALIPKSRMGEGIGYLGIGYVVAVAIGPSSGLWIVHNFGFKICFISSAIIVFLAAISLYIAPLKNEKNPDSSIKKIKFSDLIGKEVIVLSVLAGIMTMGIGINGSFLALMAQKRGILNIGTFFTVYAICVFVARPLLGRQADKSGLSLMVIPSFILMGLSMFLLGKSYSLEMSLAAGILMAIGQGAANPTLQKACIEKLGPERRGVAISTYYIGMDMGQGFGPMLGGAISQNFGYGAMYSATSVVMFLAIAIFLAYKKVMKKKGIVI